MQRLRSHRPRRDGPLRQNFGQGHRDRRGCDRALGADHSIARRDGARRQRNGAARIQNSAAHWRCHHICRAHGNQDCRALLRPDRACARCLALGARHYLTAFRRPTRRIRPRQPRETKIPARKFHQRTKKGNPHARASARCRAEIRLGKLHSTDADISWHADGGDAAPRPRGVHRLDAILSCVGTARRVGPREESAQNEKCRRRGRSIEALSRRAWLDRSDHCGEQIFRARHLWIFSRQRIGRRHHCLDR